MIAPKTSKIAVLLLYLFVYVIGLVSRCLFCVLEDLAVLVDSLFWGKLFFGVLL